ncbi:ABC transporter ATP-binding protein [Mobilitalea sibirica]|uniref:ABC transporter ATP-binding protein n=1 Tax=Mobilitalea sibirica TaxID=1462919 RepID=A0A8J7HB26_9FIRM|nr:ABC transporter ATP-binding protein [Mobilitalea sibirica]MBH1940601.1 ABC transporter ATP-binding protein [Mobilitalea sibirica]
MPVNTNTGRRKLSEKTDKPRDTRFVLKRLWLYIYQYKWLLALAIILTIASNMFALIGPMLSGYAIDAIEPGKGFVVFKTVFYYSAWMIGFYIVSSILSYILSVMMIRLTQKIVRKMREDVFTKLVELPVSYFDRNQAGDIISKISYDIDTINTSLSTDVVQICASVITVVGSLIMMIVISPQLVLVMLVTIPLSLLYTRYMAKKVRPLFRRRSAKLGELNGFVEEMVSGQKTIKAYAAENTVVERFDKINKETVDAYYTAEYYGSMTGPTVNFINNLSLSLITVFGAILYLNRAMTLGNISSFVQYSRKFSGPINEVANIISELQSAAAAAERVFKLIDEQPESPDRDEAKELNSVKGDVVIEGVTFGYLPDKVIIKNLFLHAKPGSLTAIVGPTGGGKTTIINLLMRFYDVWEGKILVDGTETRDLTRESLRKAYAMVLQDTWLFAGTIFDNIAYGKEDATMEEVVAAAKMAGIHSYIKRLPMGYDTIVNEDGLNISKGQKQLLTIARAMLLDAKMLILDEATSNVDTRTEIKIQKAMRKLMEEKTCFVIAHRLSTIQGADNILVIDQGNVVEQGTHKELMEQKGFYYKLYNSQFE